MTAVVSDVERLQAVLPQLSSRDREFAESLLEAARGRGLSYRQGVWVKRLADRAAPSLDHEVQLGSFTRVVSLFETAKSHLKWPKVTLDCSGSDVVISMAGARSRHSGSINVASPGSFDERVWYGRISPDGSWSPSASVDQEMLSALVELLTAFGSDPAGVAKRYGKLTGSCCFCARRLSDARSRAAGFGPVCADHYGLKAEWEAAANNSRDDAAVVDAYAPA